jgi:hypothetical protein
MTFRRELEDETATEWPTCSFSVNFAADCVPLLGRNPCRRCQRFANQCAELGVGLPRVDQTTGWTRVTAAR